jgi:hypothetical protein
MKYQGSISEVQAIQSAMQAEKFICFVDKKTGFSGLPGVEPSSLYTIRLVLEDKSCTVKNTYLPLHGWLFFVSFNYKHRENSAEMWVKDEDTGRMLKVFPQILPLFGKLKAIKLEEKEAQIVREHYQVEKIIRSEA